MKKIIYLLISLLIIVPLAAQKNFTVVSPDTKIAVNITISNKIQYSVNYLGKAIINPSPLSLTLYEGKTLGQNPSLKKTPAIRSINSQVKPLYGMADVYPDIYNEIKMDFAGNYSVIFRVYNNGVAYRITTSLPGTIKIKNEEVVWNFPEKFQGYIHQVKNFETSFEEHYTHDAITVLDKGALASLPLYVDAGVAKMVITEADLLDYPGLYLTFNGKSGLQGVLPQVPKTVLPGGLNNFNLRVQERFDYIAETPGTREFPWRLTVIVPEDKDLLFVTLPYLLGSECKIGDASWIKPGKVAWDWWNANNLTGVPFKTGFNTETYKYFIDFAARNGIEYINLDEGWSDQFDLLKINDGSVTLGTNPTLSADLNMKELFDYAKEKNVGIILWCVWHTLDRQLEEALSQFEKWGVAGLKVDFMDRDDQLVVNFYERVAREAAKRHMLVNFHGAYKPTGMERTYPNVINREGVQGLEYNKFSNQATPEHAVSIPFIRMLAGPMDYTPGAMTNANKEDFRIINDRPMSQGSRCQQLAMYVVYYAPLEMLSDAPTRYEKEPEILRFLASAPTVWDETLPLDGKVGDYVLMARRKGTSWWVGAMTDWTARTLTLDLQFLGEGTYTMELFRDGANAHRIGDDFVCEIKTVTKNDTLLLELAPGGGWAARITPNN